MSGGSIRVRFVSSLANGHPFASGDFTQEEGFPLVRIRDLSVADFSTFVPSRKVPERALIRDRDVVIGMDGDFNAVIWDRGPAALNQRVCLLRAGEGHDARFLHYAITPELQRMNDLAYSTTVKHLSSEDVLNISIPHYSHSEQRRMADYLDRETAEIDAMDAELDRLVDTLRERRQVVSSGLHNRGLEVRRLKWLMNEVDDRAGSRAADLPLLSVSIHFGVQMRDDSSSNQAASTDLSHYKVAQRGDVVLNRMRAFQGGLGVAPVDGVVSPDYSVLRVDKTVLTSAWAEYTMRSPEFVAAMTQALRGIGSADQGNVRTPRINVRDLLDLSIPLPPPHEQRRIVAELDKQTAQIDDMVADANRLKTLLAERRSTLITEVVTGKKEVPA